MAAGNGEQDRLGRGEGGDALKTGLNSPWGMLATDANTIFVAMAGHHQIWKFDLGTNKVSPFAGSGRENIKDGPLLDANFAQPSGLATDGTNLFVADSETSSIRALRLNGKGNVDTLIGVGLFEFGDKDGTYPDARLQHPLGIAYYDGKVIVADTYNSKIKAIDPKTKTVKTLFGTGKEDKDRMFFEPAGLSLLDNTLYVADTDKHRIQVIDMKTNKVSTLELKGVPPVKK